MTFFIFAMLHALGVNNGLGHVTGPIWKRSYINTILYNDKNNGSRDITPELFQVIYLHEWQTIGSSYTIKKKYYWFSTEQR
jgi:hypothetical protein